MANDMVMVKLAYLFVNTSQSMVTIRATYIMSLHEFLHGLRCNALKSVSSNHQRNYLAAVILIKMLCNNII